MGYQISDLNRNAQGDASVDRIDNGAGPGIIEFFTGNAPANNTDADSGAKLGTLTMSDPAFGNTAAGVATAAAITGDTAADATGVAGHVRIKDSNGVVEYQGNVTVTAGGGFVEVNDINFVAGAAIDITSITITWPAS